MSLQAAPITATAAAKKGVPTLPKIGEKKVERKNEFVCGIGGEHIGLLSPGQKCGGEFSSTCKEAINPTVLPPKKAKIIQANKKAQIKKEVYTGVKSTRKGKKWTLKKRDAHFTAKIEGKKGKGKGKGNGKGKGEGEKKEKLENKKSQEKIISKELLKGNNLSNDPASVAKLAKKLIHLEQKGKLQKEANKKIPITDKPLSKLGKMSSKKLGKALKKKTEKKSEIGNFCVQAIVWNLSHCCHYKSRKNAQRFADTQPQEGEFNKKLRKAEYAARRDKERKATEALKAATDALAKINKKEIKKEAKKTVKTDGKAADKK
jgi:hypothetical protein